MRKIDDPGFRETRQYDALHDSDERTLVAEVSGDGYDTRRLCRTAH
jgi:hypothetical protein